MKDVETIINNLAGIAGTLMGIERNHSEFSEIIDKKIKHISEVIEFVKEQHEQIEVQKKLLEAYKKAQQHWIDSFPHKDGDE